MDGVSSERPEFWRVVADPQEYRRRKKTLRPYVSLSAGQERWRLILLLNLDPPNSRLLSVFALLRGECGLPRGHVLQIL